MQDLAILTGGQVGFLGSLHLFYYVLPEDLIFISIFFFLVSFYNEYQVITEELGLDLEKVGFESLGSCKKVKYSFNICA